jgi:hypothetical protein
MKFRDRAGELYCHPRRGKIVLVLSSDMRSQIHTVHVTYTDGSFFIMKWTFREFVTLESDEYGWGRLA